MLLLFKLVAETLPAEIFSLSAPPEMMSRQTVGCERTKTSVVASSPSRHHAKHHDTPQTSDGKMSKQSFLSVVRKEDHQTEFREAFNAFDWNHSGRISYGSLQVSSHPISPSLSTRYIDIILNFPKCII